MARLVCKVDDGLYRELKKVADMNSEKLSDLVSYILKTALLGECVYIDSELYEKLVEKCHGHVDVMITVNKLLEAFVNNKVVIKEVL